MVSLITKETILSISPGNQRWVMRKIKKPFRKRNCTQCNIKKLSIMSDNVKSV
jgi:hypothetical protein